MIIAVLILLGVTNVLWWLAYNHMNTSWYDKSTAEIDKYHELFTDFMDMHKQALKDQRQEIFDSLKKSIGVSTTKNNILN